MKHKKKAAIHLTDTRQYPQLFLFVDYECIFLSDFAVLKSAVRQKRGFGSQGAFPHFVRSAPTDFALLKSDVRQKRGFGSQGAFPHFARSAQSDFALLKSVVRQKRGLGSQRAFPHFARSAQSDFVTAVGSTKHL